MASKPRKVSTGFKTASTPDFKTAKAAMTDAPPVTAQPEDHVDCTQILGDVEAYEGPTQLNEEEEDETPMVPRQTPSGTAGPPPPRPRFSYTSQSSTPPPPATAPDAAAAPDALRDVLATAPVQRQLSDASRHATAGDTAPPEPIDLTQDEDTEVEPSQPRAAAPAPAPAPYESAPTEVDPAADPLDDDPIEDDDDDEDGPLAATQVEAPAAPPPMEDDPIEDADAVDAILDAGRLRTQDPPPAEE